MFKNVRLKKNNEVSSGIKIPFWTNYCFQMCLVTEFKNKIISDHDAQAVSSHAKQSAN